MLRLLMIGLCTACVVLLATFQPLRIQVVQQPAPPAAPPRMVEDRVTPVRVVDVTASVEASTMMDLLRLADGEHVTSINDRAVDDDYEPAALISMLGPRAGQYVDLTISTATSERRVLVLLH